MITKIHYNWHQSGDGKEFGEDYYVAKIDQQEHATKKTVKEIIEHCATGEGDKWYYDIIFIDKTRVRVFNPNKVFYDDKEIK